MYRLLMFACRTRLLNLNLLKNNKTIFIYFWTNMTLNTQNKRSCSSSAPAGACYPDDPLQPPRVPRQCQLQSDEGRHEHQPGEGGRGDGEAHKGQHKGAKGLREGKTCIPNIGLKRTTIGPYSNANFFKGILYRFKPKRPNNRFCRKMGENPSFPTKIARNIYSYLFVLYNHQECD